MMPLSPSAADLPGLRLRGWVASLLLHATVGGTAILTMPDVTVIPQEEPFRLDVSIVRTATGEPAAASASPSPAAAAPHAAPVPPAEVRPSLVEPAPPAPPETRAEPEPAQAATAITQPVPPPAPVPEPVPPTPREIVRHDMAYPTQEDAPQQVAAKAVTQAAPAESPAAVGAATQDARPADQPTPAASRPASAAQGPPADYGWLAQSLWKRVVELKRYPHRARLNHWEGTVVLRAVIRHDGHLEALTLQDSSGHEELDEAAMELVREACPLQMTQPLGRAQVVVQVPITYALR